MENYAIFHSYVSLTEGNPSMKMSANQVLAATAPAQETIGIGPRGFAIVQSDPFLRLDGTHRDDSQP